MDAPRIEVVLAEGLGFVSRADDRDAIGSLGEIDRPALDQELPSLQPLEGDPSLARPRGAFGRPRLQAPLPDQGIEPLKRGISFRFLRESSFPILTPMVDGISRPDPQPLLPCRGRHCACASHPSISEANALF